MPSRNKYWHKEWAWHAPGVVVHTSGLQVDARTGRAPMASITACALHEAARGVCDRQMPDRVAALLRDGARWAQDPRNRPRKDAQHLECVACVE